MDHSEEAKHSAGEQMRIPSLMPCKVLSVLENNGDDVQSGTLSWILIL